jgi:hypothetical protein
MAIRAPSLAALAALLLGAGACGADDAAEREPPRPPPETAHPVPELPSRWEVRVNRAGGFAFGLPPGWRARDRGTSTLVRSLDRLVAVSIVPDRTRDAIETPLDDFARRTIAALPGFESELEPRRERGFPHRYRGVRVEARATAAGTGARQQVQVVVLRRGRQATFTVVIAVNVRGGEASEEVAERMVRTLRGRPVD